jgi:Cytochrome P450
MKSWKTSSRSHNPVTICKSLALLFNFFTVSNSNDATERMHSQSSADSQISLLHGELKEERCICGELHPIMQLRWRITVKRVREMELYGGYLDELKADVLRSSQSNCYVASYLKERADNGHADALGLGITDDGWMRDTMLADTAGTLLEAGSDTTSSALRSFVLFMLSHPQVVSKTREEIDRVVGTNRMPDFENEFKLPYVTACVKECLRCRPPAILVRGISLSFSSQVDLK